MPGWAGGDGDQIKARLRQVPGLEAVQANPLTGNVLVNFNPRVTGPQQGFGKLWQRTYSAPLRPTVSPQQLITEWKENFGSFWPKGNRFGAA